MIKIIIPDFVINCFAAGIGFVLFGLLVYSGLGLWWKIFFPINRVDEFLNRLKDFRFYKSELKQRQWEIKQLKAENEKLKAWLKRHYIETCPEYGVCMPKIGESPKDMCNKCKKVNHWIERILKAGE